jgi:hypothetical protein
LSRLAETFQQAAQTAVSVSDQRVLDFATRAGYSGFLAER